ncbi:hypothetical protein AaE_007537 [Aphanomyces astaci]|uniref:DUF4291 domain-containing protein n=1 Tax=Aphanomyces astaci TaxID=112090 RepID=A0A6A5AGB2_APHAT|nr:hypothetical protein AaE_007537 [Aphanomyces astaci]
MEPLALELYHDAVLHWPAQGQVILAQHSSSHIVVYQAYNAAIANALVTAQNYHDPAVAAAGFIPTRMTWIKPNFLWMMYRSSWTQARNQECIVAVTLLRDKFDAVVRDGVLSSFDATSSTRSEWQDQVAHSNVRIQWDPDHLPDGRKHAARRAIQIGLRREALMALSHNAVVDMVDITAFVTRQRQGSQDGAAWLASLVVPVEREYFLGHSDTT